MATDRSVTSVKVKMYRHGFGDCFLLSFFRAEMRVFTMLVDCGIKHNTSSKEVPIEEVIRDLQSTLIAEGESKPRLDVLVATHEHWDHISFFHPTRWPDYFGQFDIGNVWLSWTEDPGDKEAVAINARLRRGVDILGIAADLLQRAEANESDKGIRHARQAFNASMDGVLGFYGVGLRDTSESGIDYKTNGSISRLTEEALKNVIHLGQTGGGVSYLSPGTMVPPQMLTEGINVYVLGPPRNSRINQSNPARGATKQTYLGIDNSGLTSFIDSVLKFGESNDGQSTGESSGPFGEEAGQSVVEAQNEYYQSTYYKPEEAYRRIEHNWLDIAGQFALQLDGAINNTSLVLAIELTQSGKVLLFPGDAQVGSWLSWHDHEWKVLRGGKTETVKARDLLERTVLYKVSHHGSHNATVAQEGLELMTHPELVAMMPEKQESYSGIPHPPLMERLKRMCKGRVIVSADINFPPEKLLESRPAELSAREWKAFKDELVVEPVFVEYTIRS